MSTDRREFLKLLSTAAAASAFPASVARALAIPANNRTGTINDVEHVVFMMQENRAFDLYFGTLRGVRGFGDPRAVKLPTGKSVFYQPDATNPDGFVLPFRPNAANLGQMYLLDTPHGWNDTHAAWNGGAYDQWIPNKGDASMAHLERQDIPYHYALADAFTVCDAYYYSVLGANDPNRYHMWTGWVGNDGSHVAPQGPVINNAEVGYNWSTYPELLEQAGVSWKIYQDVGTGLDAADFWGFTNDAFIGNFGDNSLLYFLQYQNAPDNSPLALKARTGTNILQSGTLFDAFRADVLSNQLPQVSWIVAPEGYTEHGNWPSNFGAYYVSQMLDALTANPDVWGKTVFFYMFDENDGFFDHLVPPTPPRSRAEGISTLGTTNDLFEVVPNSDYPPDRFVAGPYGLGVRVPMIVISPWSKGGWVNSQVFDHTSLIRFVETRFAKVGLLKETNITPWRRAVVGDLTSAFNFANPNSGQVPLPGTDGFEPPDFTKFYRNYNVVAPGKQALPKQEPGVRPARALPYTLHAHGKIDASGGTFGIDFRNAGRAAAVFQVRSGSDAHIPRTYTVEPNKSLSDTWNLGSIGIPNCDLSVYGPNGFLRAFKGSVAGLRTSQLDLQTDYDEKDGDITLVITNLSAKPAEVF